MNYIDILKNPWFYRSPSPWSLIFYLIMTLYGYRKLKGIDYARWPGPAGSLLARLVRLTDAFAVFALIIMVQDTLWLTFNTVRWWPEYHQYMDFSYFACFLRNGAAAALFFIMTVDKYGQAWRFNRKTFAAFLVQCGVLGIVFFILAADPGMTDWTYAIRHNQADEKILAAFLLSHVIMKILNAWIYSTVWPRRSSNDSFT